MAIASGLLKYLADENVAFGLVPHRPTKSAIRSAVACRIPPDYVVKGVVLRNGKGYWLAVVPASCRVVLDHVRAAIGEHVELATEEEIGQMFPDCRPGAIPPLGACYGLDVIIDESIKRQPDLYLEAGDHMTLVRMSRAEFVRLNKPARRGSFACAHVGAAPASAAAM